MLSAEEQLLRVEAALLGSGGVPVAESTILFVPGDLAGFLDVDLVYPSGHKLSVLLAIDVSYGYPLWTNYSFHFAGR